MSGGFSIGGLVTGLDTETLIEQLMQLERQPILRLQDRIAEAEQEQSVLRDLRTTLTNLSNRASDFRLLSAFDDYTAVSSDESVLGASVSGANPTAGSYDIEVLQLASATEARSSDSLGSPISSATVLDSAGLTTEVTAGTFSINGVELTVDPSTDSLDDVLSDINASSAGVTATYDSATGLVTLTNSTVGDSSIINLGGSDDDSNFLTAINVLGATQGEDADGSTEVVSTRNLGAVDPNEDVTTLNFAGGALTTGVFSINGVAINIDSGDTLQDVIGAINTSDANVTASYDTSNDTIRVVSDSLGSRTIRFGSASDTSNFLSLANLDTATQTAGRDAQLTVNGGATLTRSSNEIADVIGGVTLNLQSTGTSTITVETDNDAVVEQVQEFLDEVNTAVSEIRDMVGSGGSLENDMSIRMVQDFIRQTVLGQVSGLSGDYDSLISIGITTGDSFDSGTLASFELDEDAFREALRTDRENVEALFSNDSGTGIADLLEDYLDETTSTGGFLNQRARESGLIDQRIESYNDQIDRIEERLTMREERLRRQFTQMEQLSANFQQQGSALSGISSGLTSLI